MNNFMIAAEETLRCRETVNGLTGLGDISKDFYYDETNNYRKFHFKSGRLNIEDVGEFLLGGVVVDKGRSIDISELKKEIRLDKTANELKFKHVAKGSLPDVLKSKKIKSVLEFLVNERIDVHFQRVNSFYWGIVDIIESVLSNLPNELKLCHWGIKDYLYNALTTDIENTVNMLHTYNYPDIDSSKISKFYDDVSCIVKRTTSTNKYLHESLLYALQIGGNQDEAVFIQDEEKLILVDNYSPFYRDRLLTFPASNHYLDMEENIKTSLDLTLNSFQGAPLLNYKFLNSHESDWIQLSDVIIGLTAKIINYCNRLSESELISFRRNIGNTESRILDLVEELITRSHDECRAYFHNVVPLSHLEVLGNLLRKLN